MQLLILILSLVIFSLGCSEHHTQTITLKGATYSDKVIYETNNAKIILTRAAILKYCKSKDTTDYNNFIYRDLATFVENHPTDPLLIPDTIGTMLIPFNEVYLTSQHKDSLVRVRDEKSNQGFIPEATEWLVLSQIKKGQVQIFNKNSNIFVEKVIFDSIESRTAGESAITFEDGTTIIKRLRWIK